MGAVKNEARCKLEAWFVSLRMATSSERDAAVRKPSDSEIDEDVQTIVDACLNELGRPPPPSVTPQILEHDS